MNAAITANTDADSKYQELTLKMNEATAEITEIKSENEELLRKVNETKKDESVGVITETVTENLDQGE